MSILDNVNVALVRLERALHSDMGQLAEVIEKHAQEEAEGHWEDDSGSARASITAYSLGKGDWGHNFSADAWRRARSAGYTSPIWNNPSSNFQDYSEAVDIGEIGVALTMFVPYALALERGLTAGGGLPQRGNKHGKRRMVIPNLISSVGGQHTSDFIGTIILTISENL